MEYALTSITDTLQAIRALYPDIPREEDRLWTAYIRDGLFTPEEYQEIIGSLYQDWRGRMARV